MPTKKGEAGPDTRNVESSIDALYQLPLAEFTAARNALAASLKKAGRVEDMERVRSLVKPSVTAWTVNQLYWKHRDAFDRLIETGEQFRRAQASQLAGKSTDIKGPLDARRAALTDLARLAATTLEQAGSTATPDHMRRLTSTLEALSAYGALPDAPRAGRLTDDVDPPGFETLAALVPRVGGEGRGSGPTRIIPFEQKQPKGRRRKGTPEEEAKRDAEERKARQAAAEAKLQESERALRDARKAAQQAEERLKKAAARAKEAEKEKAEAERRFEKASAEAETARQEARRVAAEAEDAAQAVEDAERALERARGEMEKE
jgi:hypothetical protein